jgi:hypothetical protein
MAGTVTLTHQWLSPGSASKKGVDLGDSCFSRDYHIRAGVCRRLAGPAGRRLDASSGTKRLFRSDGYKILEVRMRGSDHAGNASDLVAPTNNAVRFVEHVVERLMALSENPTMG